MTEKNELPPFPVDETTLGMLEAAMNPREHGDPEATQSSVWPFLEFMSQLAGSDTESREEMDDGTIVIRGPRYTERCVIEALIAEVRRLRPGAA